MTKKKKLKKRKLTEAEEKDVDYFTERLVNILIMQVEQEALAKEEKTSDKKKPVDK